MQLVQFRLILKFAKDLSIYSISDRLQAKVGVSKLNEQNPIIERGVQIKVAQGKSSIIWNSIVLDITAEDVADSEKGIDYLLSLIELVNSEIAINEISWRRFMTCWILPKPEYDFKSLEQKYRQIMLAQNSISNSAFDSSSIFDIKAKKGFLHHQSGAMEPSQLYRTYLRYRLDSTPRTFLFLEASIWDNDLIKYSKSEMKQFMLNCLPTCINHSLEFEQIWEGQL